MNFEARSDLNFGSGRRVDELAVIFPIAEIFLLGQIPRTEDPRTKGEVLAVFFGSWFLVL
jgi:hypothetical protein